MPFGVLRIVRFVRPGIGHVRLGMSLQIEDLYNSVPDRLALPHFLYRHALTVRSGRTVELVDNRLEFVYVLVSPCACSAI